MSCCEDDDDDLLQDDDIKAFYQNCLNQQLQQVETNKNIETKWWNTKGCIEEAAKEAIG